MGFGNSKRNIVLILFVFFAFQKIFAQDSTKISQDSVYLSKQKDLVDIFYQVIHKSAAGRLSDSKNVPGKLLISGSPTIQYSLQTGVAYNITSNLAFYTSKLSEQNISSILLSPIYTQKKQIVIPIQTSIWTKGNKWNFIGDWRFLKYPEDTYGLGGYTLPSDGYKIFYYYFRFYQFAEYTIKKDMYIGVGYQLDNHWSIQELNPIAVTDFQKYGFNSSSRSSGISFNFLYDNRRNSINPHQGFYSNIVYRENMKWLGSDNRWSGLLIDLRKYIPVSTNSKNVLAFWSYNWLTTSGNPPYLDLPSTGWDTYSNSGRGYVQSRFRSKNMIDLESEFRFGITRNGLLGGVLFGNLQSYSQMNNNSFQTISPGYGAGLRVKFNKFSKTNVCIDYAFGKHDSNGLFLNLGEVF